MDAPRGVSPPPLLDICIDALACQLCTLAQPHDIAALPEPELALRLAARCQALLARAPLAAAFPAALRLAEACATAWWQAPRLRLSYQLHQSTWGLSRLPLFAGSLEHLELDAPVLLSLAPLAACTRLVCLSLAGCSSLPAAALSALPALPRLRALDLSSLAQVTDAAAAWIARLPALEQLDLDRTGVGDPTLDALTYGCRLAAYAAGDSGSGRGTDSGSGRSSTALPPEAAGAAAAWPPLPLRQLRLLGTRVTGAGAAHLTSLADLQLLDVRRTAVPRAALQPLLLRRGLGLVQGSVLASSVALAAHVINNNPVPCCCGTPLPRAGTEQSAVERWAAHGRQRLLTVDPTLPPAGLLADVPALAPPGGQVLALAAPPRGSS
eukprot:scaffold2.g7372.t1